MASASFTMTDPSGLLVNVTVTEVTVDGVTSLEFSIDVDESTGVLAEVNGVFFDLGGDDVLDDSLTTDAISISSAEDDVSNLGGGINVKGDVVKTYGEFDAGVVVDETGLAGSYNDGPYDFTVSREGEESITLDEFLGQNFALRLTSVGADGSQEGSLKLGTTTPTEPDPVDDGTGGDEGPGDEDLAGIDPELPGDQTAGETGTESPTVGGSSDGETADDGTTGGEPGDGTTDGTPDGTTDDTVTDDTATEPASPDPLLDEWFAVQKDETAGDTDGDVLANDDPALTIVSVTNSGGETFAVTEGGTTIPGTEGGMLTAYPDGTVDFDAGEDFANLYDGESTDVVFTYTTDTDQTASVTVTVDGAGAPDDGMDDPILPPIEDGGTADSTLDPEEPLLGDDVLLG